MRRGRSDDVRRRKGVRRLVRSSTVLHCSCLRVLLCVCALLSSRPCIQFHPSIDRSRCSVSSDGFRSVERSDAATVPSGLLQEAVATGEEAPCWCVRLSASASASQIRPLRQPRPYCRCGVRGLKGSECWCCCRGIAHGELPGEVEVGWQAQIRANGGAGLVLRRGRLLVLLRPARGLQWQWQQWEEYCGGAPFR